jgi:hypothetical protein
MLEKHHRRKELSLCPVAVNSMGIPVVLIPHQVQQQHHEQLVK